MNRLRIPLLAAVAALLTLVPDLEAQRGRRPFKPGFWRTKKDYAKGFVVHTTRHYQIQSQAGMDKAKRLGKHMETMFKVYYKCFNPKKPFLKKQAIKLLKNRAQFIRYGAPPGAGAYYSPMEHEMVCYDTGKWMDEQDADDNLFDNDDEEDLMDPNYYRKIRAKYQMDILGAAAHEGWHQYFHWLVVSPVQLPSWLNEGMGDYFYSARPKKVKGRRMPAELGRMNHMRLPIVKLAIRRKQHVPIPTLLSYSKRDYYRNASVCYAEGWALCQFLMHHESKKYRDLIPRFVFFVKNDTNLVAVTKKVFKGIDLDKLDEEWKTWVTNVRMDGTVRAAEAAGNGDKSRGKSGKGNGKGKAKTGKAQRKDPVTP
ncbi:MAG: DUF1570 domain-containing protein [Planctomycetota bacterium]|jgi:hypothetical protein